MGYGLRAVLVVLLLALACRWGVAQVGPRYVIELPGAAAVAVAASQGQGQVQLAGRGLVLIRFQGLSMLAVDADSEAYSQEAVHSWPAADLLLVLPASSGRYEGLAPLRALRHGMPVIMAETAEAARVAVAAAGGPRLYPMQPWNTLDLRKHGARLRVTAMPGRPGTVAVAGYLLEVGNRRASYRLYAGAAGDEAAALAQRLPGADVALLSGREGPQLLALNRGAPPSPGQPAALTAAGYAFKAVRR